MAEKEEEKKLQNMGALSSVLKGDERFIKSGVKRLSRPYMEVSKHMAHSNSHTFLT